MPNYFISKLQIEGFRGINNENDPLELSFKHDQVNSIFASNAQGKSSIFDALSFAIRGSVPKLSLLKQSEHAENYYVNQFHSAASATIVITLQPDDGTPQITIRVRRLPNGTRVVDSPSGHSTPETLLSSLDSEFCLLDYRSFINFVEDSPLDRGRAFSSLLGLGKISEFRQALAVLSNTRSVNTDFQINLLNGQERSLNTRKDSVATNIRASYFKLTNQQATGTLDETLIINKSTDALKDIPLL